MRALSRPLAERVLLLYAHVPIPESAKAGIYWLALSYTNPRSAEETQLLDAALNALRKTPLESVPKHDRPGIQFLLIEVLRLLGRFEDARVEVGILSQEKSSLTKDNVRRLENAAELVELRESFRLPLFWPPIGTVGAKIIESKQTTYGAPANQRMLLASQPLKARYPIMMRYAGISGEVVVAVEIARDGTVANAKALRASQREFAEIAVAFARECRFSLAETEGSSNHHEATLAVLFTLTEE